MYGHGTEDVPGRARLMKIKVKQATHKVGPMTLSVGYYTQNASEALQE
jgi:hypothetical protein